MSKKQDLSDFGIERISLSQQISAKDPNLKHYVGSNTELARKISKIITLMEYGLLDKNDPELNLGLDLLKGEIKAVFLSSDKTDIFSKLGFWLPRKAKELSLK